MVIGRCRYYSKGQGGESGTNGNLRGGGRRAEGKNGGGGRHMMSFGKLQTNKSMRSHSQDREEAAQGGASLSGSWG